MVHRDIYKERRHHVISLIAHARKDYFCNLVAENSGDQKALFAFIKTLTASKKETILPPCDGSLENLSSQFGKFFADKITAIRDDLIILQQQCVMRWSDTPFQGDVMLSAFKELMDDDILKVVMRSPTQSSPIDPIPTWILKQCIPEIIPAIKHIVNLSLKLGTVPNGMKSAMITPVLKKPNLQPICKNYRPVSNLSFLSKILERAVSAQLQKHLEVNNVSDNFQSAYRAGHSTETALVRVQNDLLCALDKGELAVLVLLDLSAAFDTVEHSILLHRLEKRVGICGTPLSWLKSYLTNRSQSVCIKGYASPSLPLSQGVPQGSVLGVVLLSQYTLPVGDIAMKHCVQYHIYADDKQLYFIFRPGQTKEAMAKVTSVISDLRTWMTQNFLKLNTDKTEVLLLGTKC